VGRVDEHRQHRQGRRRGLRGRDRGSAQHDGERVGDHPDDARRDAPRGRRGVGARVPRVVRVGRRSARADRDDLPAHFSGLPPAAVRGRSGARGPVDQGRAQAARLPERRPATAARQPRRAARLRCRPRQDLHGPRRRRAGAARGLGAPADRARAQLHRVEVGGRLPDRAARLSGRRHRLQEEADHPRDARGEDDQRDRHARRARDDLGALPGGRVRRRADDVHGPAAYEDGRAGPQGVRREDSGDPAPDGAQAAQREEEGARWQGPHRARGRGAQGRRLGLGGGDAGASAGVEVRRRRHLGRDRRGPSRRGRGAELQEPLPARAAGRRRAQVHGQPRRGLLARLAARLPHGHRARPLWRRRRDAALGHAGEEQPARVLQPHPVRRPPRVGEARDHRSAAVHRPLLQDRAPGRRSR